MDEIIHNPQKLNDIFLQNSWANMTEQDEEKEASGGAINIIIQIDISKSKKI